MLPTPSALRLSRLALVPGMLLALLLLACGSKSEEPPAVYRTRARVVELSGSGDSTRVTLEHEAIAGFKDRNGTASEMPAMKMAFGIGPTVDAQAFTPGSQWEVTFDVVWQREPVLLITAAKPLPAATKLELAPH